MNGLSLDRFLSALFSSGKFSQGGVVSPAGMAQLVSQAPETVAIPVKVFRLTRPGRTKFEVFNERNAPVWLTGEKTVKGSTMDCRWFWTDHVLKLEVGEAIRTDHALITRTA